MRTLLLRLSPVLPLACLAAAASAQERPVAASAERDAARSAEDTQQSTTPFATAAVDDAALEAVAGREDTRQVALNEQSATVSRNSVGDNSATGDARVDGNAFQNMTGMSILNINTGNNVAINAAMTVNISIQSGP